MIHLRRVFESFSGQSGTYWKTGTNGTATQFVKWLREQLQSYFDRNKAADTTRSYVVQEGEYETLVISFGNKKEIPLDFKVGVCPKQPSRIILHIRPTIFERKWIDKEYILHDPNSLSIDDNDKLVSVIFKKDRFPKLSPDTYTVKDIPKSLSLIDALYNAVNTAWNMEKGDGVPDATPMDSFSALKSYILSIKDIQVPYDAKTLKDTIVSSNLDTVAKSKLPDGKLVESIPECKSLIKQILKVPVPKLSKDLTEIPEFVSALKAFSAPVREAGNHLVQYSVNSAIVTDFDTFEKSEVVRNLKDTYSYWKEDYDLAELHKGIVTYIFMHPDDTELSFRAKVRSIGGDRFTVDYININNKVNFWDDLQNELKRLKNPSVKEESYGRYYEITRASNIIGSTSLEPFKEKGKLDDYVQKIIKAIDDLSISNQAQLEISINKVTGEETWDLLLKTACTGSKASKDCPNVECHVIWKVDSKGFVEDMTTNFGFTPNVKDRHLTITSPEFLHELSRASDSFRDQYAAFGIRAGKQSGSNTPTRDVRPYIDPSQLPMQSPEGWITQYINPEYNMKNWEDLVREKIDPALQKLIDKYNLTLEEKSEQPTESEDDYLTFLAKYNLVDSVPKNLIQDDIEHTGNLVFLGDYLDKFLNPHTLELRVNFERGFYFLIWIRPDGKGGEQNKAHGQSDMSFFEKWVKDNVSLRSTVKSKELYTKAIIEELINRGAMRSSTRNSVEFATSNLNNFNIGVRVTDEKIYADVYYDSKMRTFEIPYKPYEVPASKVATKIKDSVKNLTPKSFVVRDVVKKEEYNRYWTALLDRVAMESKSMISHNGFETICMKGRKCRFTCEDTGRVKLYNLMGREIASELFNMDIRFFKDDVKDMYKLIEENYNKF